MTTDDTPSVDWTALGRAFADAHSEIDANELLHTGIDEPEPDEAIVDAAEPKGTEEARTHWLKPVSDLRSYFRHEAAHLTPWLAKRLWLIQRAALIDEELTLVGTEQRIAGYRIDILAKTQVGGRERYVVIENQLEKSDADHLGRLITCAAEVEASHAIWIGVDFRPDHLKVMEALGRREQMACQFIPLQLGGATPKENFANFSFTSPPTYPTPEDPMREILHAHMRNAQQMHFAARLFRNIYEANPSVDFTRYRQIIQEMGLWAYYTDELVDEILEQIPQERRTHQIR